MLPVVLQSPVGRELLQPYDHHEKQGRREEKRTKKNSAVQKRKERKGKRKE